jgi:TonB-dependent SusC/RagA subfamily outer membrane receptor
VNSSEPLFIVDGVPVDRANYSSIQPENIESINVLKKASATAIYGSRGREGVVVISTKKGKDQQGEQIELLETEIQEKSQLKSWEENSAYMRKLSSISSNQEAYIEYLALREDHNNRPSFYLDVADFFAQRRQKERAIQILTNLIEIEIDNIELLRALAYKLEDFGEYDLAVTVYEKVLELRPEHPQSYRDLALAYAENKQYQKSFDLLYSMYLGNLIEKDENDNYSGIEQIAYVELCRLANTFQNEIEIPELVKDELKPFAVDVRVVVDWNHDDTDLDLWVEDPYNEVASYKRKKTKIGGRMSKDMTNGFGPEEFMLKRAPQGSFKVSVDYYSDRVQKISGPTILKVTLFKNYGRENEEKEIQVYRLDKGSDEIEVGNIKV